MKGETRRLSILWGIILAIAACYLLFIFPTQWLKVEKVSHSLGLNIKILQISDMHIERLRIRPEQLRRVIQQERPDYLFLTGDYTKLEAYLPLLKRYLNVFQASGIPAFGVLGNHDYQQRKVSKLIKLLQQSGIHLLRNESVRLPGFELIGIDDYDSGKSRIGESFHGTNTGRPRIVITHDPNIVLEMRERFDYLMAGHLHGKQLNIPFFYRLRPMGKLPAMGIYKGLHRGPYGTYYISKGMGQTGVNARFLVRSEVTLHFL
ncbi:metallophosphoesterase [Paenibacillus sp. JMULE4]|nr:metallophosphoesterase [Paenibacillus sp. JMULE4]